MTDPEVIVQENFDLKSTSLQNIDQTFQNRHCHEQCCASGIQMVNRKIGTDVNNFVCVHCLEIKNF